MSYRRRIIGALLSISFSIYSFLSLFSFSILQETPNSYSITNVHNVNWGGFAGGILSNFLLTITGAGSFLLIFLILLAGILMLLNKIALLKLRFYAGAFIFFITFLILFSALFIKIPYHGFIIAGGGLAGSEIYNYLFRFFGEAGSIIIIIMLFLTSFSLIFQNIPPENIISPFYSIYSLFIKCLKLIKRLNVGIIKHGIYSIVSMIQLKLEKKKGFKKRKKSFIVNKELFGGSKEDLLKGLDEQDDSSADNKPITERNPKREKAGSFDFIDNREAKIPPISLIDPIVSKSSQRPNKLSLMSNATLIEKKLLDFGVKGKITGINPGPIITMYEFEPASGVKIGRVLSLSEDLTMALKSKPVRIAGVIEGKSAIGIEVPNNRRETVYFSEILNSKEFAEAKSPLTIILGKNIVGKNFLFDIAKCPHLLIAGATGAGKSIFINTLVTSLLFKATHEELNFLMIDPKRLELTPFEGLPHLICDVIYDAKKANIALKWAISEMERRYDRMLGASVKNIAQYNIQLKKQNQKPMPYLVIIIDELSDLMLTSPKDVETSIIRLSQMARACGIHLVMATQRPSVNVVTGVIKANMPSRIAFLVSSRVDSRTILDSNGAEELLGNGDMLFMPPGQGRLIRIHGSYASESEIKKVLEFIEAKNFPSSRNELLINEFDNMNNFDKIVKSDPDDEIYGEVLNMIESLDDRSKLSISYVQRRFRIGFNRAARIMEKLQNEGRLTKR